MTTPRTNPDQPAAAQPAAPTPETERTTGMSKYSKLWVSLGTTASVASYALQDGSLTGTEIGMISLSLFQSFLVWLVPNYAPTKGQPGT